MLYYWYYLNIILRVYYNTLCSAVLVTRVLGFYHYIYGTISNIVSNYNCNDLRSYSGHTKHHDNESENKK